MAGGIDLAFYWVLYVDILGQGDLLDQLADLPRTPAEEASTALLLRDTMGFLLGLRKWFKDFFETYGETPRRGG